MKTLIKYICLTMFLFSCALFADDERIEPGSRKLTEDQRKEVDEKQKQEIETVKKKNQVPSISKNQYPPLIFNHYIHNIVGISALGDYLIIEDASQWNIKAGDADEAFCWREKDPIMILINDSFISSTFYGYKYKMVNARTNTAIEVKLHLGPLLDSPYTLQVAAMNSLTFEIILTDNSLWQCDPSQYYLFDKWLPGDGIIVGTNTKGWFNKSYDNLLINVNLLQEVRSKRIQ